ncbi:NAC domain-containing protein 83-like isoform X2 [Oryza brachyantha]|uniref:NAC domain-containing protein 83-like isoform X2 n=1 Tax=Oryza brachyantha TaxID=4533 RepID=UPI001ADCB859|nr:NAC domain-containing protein 83-like isoform X2 [Oryza brachyantha]
MMATLRQLPPGFRFHPTDEELVVQYLRRRALSRPLPAAVIPDVHDAAVLDPWDLPGAGEGEAYFFSFRQLAPASGRKGGGGWRRRAGSGYWKPTGTEKPVFLRGFGCGGGKQLQQHLVGVKTTLVFLRAKPPSRTGWVMHEYRLAAAAVAGQRSSGNHSCMAQPAGEWVVCRIFLKNNRSSRRRLTDADGRRPATGVQGGRRRQPSPSPSSSSCVTADVSDEEEEEEEEEVSSGSINGAPAASQREA